MRIQIFHFRMQLQFFESQWTFLRFIESNEVSLSRDNRLYKTFHPFCLVTYSSNYCIWKMVQLTEAKIVFERFWVKKISQRWDDICKL